MVATPKIIAVTNKAKDQRDAEHGQDADTRDRAVRGADQAGHVAGDGGDDRSGDENVEQAEADGQAGLGADRPALGKGRQQQADRDQRNDDPADNVANGDVLLGDWQALLPTDPAGAAGGDGGSDAARDRPEDAQQSPDCSNAHGAGADEPYLLAEDSADECLDVGGRETCRPGQPGQEDEEADDHADQHGDSDSHSYEVADAYQGHGQAG
jgi:hypothetical protein